MKNSPLLAYQRDVRASREAKMAIGVLGKDAPPSAAAGSGAGAASGSGSGSGSGSRPSTAAVRPISRAGTALSRPGTVGGASRASLGSTSSLVAAPRSRKRNPAASAMFPYANADRLPTRSGPLPRMLR